VSVFILTDLIPEPVSVTLNQTVTPPLVHLSGIDGYSWYATPSIV